MSASAGGDSCPCPRPNPPPPNPPRPPNPPARSERAKLPQGRRDERVLLGASIPTSASPRSTPLPPSCLASSSSASFASAAFSSCSGRPSGSNVGRSLVAESHSGSAARIVGARVAPSASRLEGREPRRSSASSMARRTARRGFNTRTAPNIHRKRPHRREDVSSSAGTGSLFRTHCLSGNST